MSYQLPASFTEISLEWVLPIGLRGDHEHYWVVICRRDRFGARVLDCGCGQRKREAMNGNGEYVPVPVDPGPIDFLFFPTHEHVMSPALMAGA